MDVCRSFHDLQPTTIDRSQPNLVGRSSDPCKPFWIPYLPYFRCQRENMENFAYFQQVTPAIWTLGHKSKKSTRVDAYVDGQYCAQILANSITNCRTSGVGFGVTHCRPALTWLLLRSSLGRASGRCSAAEAAILATANVTHRALFVLWLCHYFCKKKRRRQ